jgi:sugar/nucleoside kinase (ribokinase family)
MSDANIDVLGIGNAIVDVLAHSDDAFLTTNNIEKGSMSLIDTARADELYGLMAPAVEISGGSAANTMVGVAGLGGKAAYLGKVRNDQLGAVFAHDIAAAGVSYDTAKALGGEPTARCLIMVTPDAQRSMNTFLGASATLSPDDVDEGFVGTAAITYLEGYLFDPAPAKEAFYKAAHAAHRAGRKVALTLSDSFCVDRYRDEFLHLIETQVDVLFANESELKALYQTDSFDDGLQALRNHCPVAGLTRSEHGSVILWDDEVHVVSAVPVDKVVDTTGAGDLYAAGFLYGLARDMDAKACGQLGSMAAAEIISHFGARPEADLKALAKDAGLLG